MLELMDRPSINAVEDYKPMGLDREAGALLIAQSDAPGAARSDEMAVMQAACEAQDAEALSGLARAFFHAGARALLVSHWYVHSETTVALIRSAFAELQTSPKIGRAEAVRRAMLGMIDQGPAWQAHPAFWAPFVVVGEGAATT